MDLLGDGFRALCERFADARVYERILTYSGVDPRRVAASDACSKRARSVDSAA